MLVVIRYCGRWRWWHATLARRLGTGGMRVVAERDTHGREPMLRFRTLIACERLIYRCEATSLAPLACSIPPSSRGTSADLTIDLTGKPMEGKGVLAPSFRGGFGLDALLTALLHGCAIPVAIVCDGLTLFSGLLANEHGDVVAKTLDQILPRLVTMLVASVHRGTGAGRPAAALPEVSIRQGAQTPSISRVLARGLLERIRGRLGLSTASEWRIAVAHISDQSRRTRAETATFAILPRAGGLEQADPFLIHDEGRTWIFFEDFSPRGSKGVIRVVEIDPEGRAGQPRLVLEQPFHLSYPLVLRHGAAWYMLPETSAASRIQLFRANEFPAGWRADRVLVEDVVASDATPIFHEGRWWIFATLADDGGSTWDQLGLYHAPDLLGPWQPHADNPVLIDAGAARPAGRMWHCKGVLMRVAQDCRVGYGAGLAICRVDRLDLEGYAQTVVERITPPPGAVGLHSLDQTASTLCVDLLASADVSEEELSLSLAAGQFLPHRDMVQHGDQ